MSFGGFSNYPYREINGCQIYRSPYGMLLSYDWSSDNVKILKIDDFRDKLYIGYLLVLRYQICLL